MEAIKHAARQVELPENFELKIIHDDVGDVTDSDLTFAQAAQAFVIGFNVSVSASLKKKAAQMQVTIKEYDIIYEFIEYLDQLAKWMVVVEKQEVVIGKLEVLGVFYRRGKEMIFGGKVIEGRIVNGAKFRVRRAEEGEKISDMFEEDSEATPFATGAITSLQKEQASVKEVKEWHECGMKVKVSKKIEVGDIIEYYIME